MSSVKYHIPNISCGHCVHTIITELSDLDGVSSVHADAETKTAVIEFEPPASEEKIIAILKEINYPPEL